MNTSGEPSPQPSGVVDLRGVPANACPACGSRVLTVQAIFDNYDIAAWFVDAQCAECGTLLTAPCPPDRPGHYFPDDTDLPDDTD